MTAVLRIVVADDHPLVRSGLAAAFAADESVEVVGQAATGAEAVEAVELLQPDVVVMDLHMPGLNGIEATSRIRRSVPGTAVLILTMYEDDASLFSALRAGARGYLLKGAEQDDIADAIRAVARGQAIFGPGIASRMLDHFANPPAAAAVELFPELTPREREILELLAAGRRTAEIAGTLHLSPKTVSNNLTNIFAKLEVADRTAAVIRARERGLGSG